MWEIFEHGKEPYFGFTNQDVFLQVPKGLRLQKPVDCPNEIWLLMFQCWEMVPKNRPTFVTVCI